MRVLVVLSVVACASESSPPPLPAPKPVAAAASPTVTPPVPRFQSCEWRYALVGGPFEPTQNITRDELVRKWRIGAIGASDEIRAALTGVLGERRTPSGSPSWTIVPAHELSPRTTVITVDGIHPLTGSGGLLTVTQCPTGRPVRNIDPAKLTTLVMSGTTALTGRTAKRIDDTGAADTVRFIKPFFASADLVHVSNEVAFVRDCHPETGQERDELVFCARRSSIQVLEALGTNLVELTGSHLIDYGHRSLSRTIDMYAQRGWIWFGGGRTQIEATEPRIVEHHGNRLAFLGCNAVAAWVRGVGPGPGVAACDWARMTWQIQDLRRRGYLPIVTVQHRELRTHAPPPDLVRDLRRLAEAGALFVLGSQAHVAHPWDVHHGAYVHYGPGNILFAQYREEQREASVDKLYVYDGKLLAVGHLFTRTEHGQPRLLDDRERTRFLGQLADAAASLEPPRPDAVPALPEPPRTQPDSLVVRGRNQYLAITPPAHLEPGARYPLVVDLRSGSRAASAPAEPDAFVVSRSGTVRATGLQIADFIRAKYPIDATRVSILPPPTRRELRVHRRGHH